MRPSPAAGPCWHWVEVCTHQAVDELLWRGRHAAASVQHHSKPQVLLVPAHVAPQQAVQDRAAARGGDAQMWKPAGVHGKWRQNKVEAHTHLDSVCNILVELNHNGSLLNYYFITESFNNLFRCLHSIFLICFFWVQLSGRVSQPCGGASFQL